MTASSPSDPLQQRVDAVGYWYHTLELAPGVVTPGHFDLREAVHRLPWPDVRGKRCLDVATFDGFYAFELERRGAAEVVAIDLDDAIQLDWLPRELPPDLRPGDEPIGRGFRLAHEVRGSSVQRVSCSVYDLDPEVLGTFDVVVCGALLQHLRDPFGALLAMRRVCHGELLSVELVDTLASLVYNHTPMTRMVGHARTWTLPNVAGHRAWLRQAGFDELRRDVVPMPLGPDARGRAATRRARVRRAVRAAGWRLLGGAPHPPFSAIRARPARGLAVPPVTTD